MNKYDKLSTFIYAIGRAIETEDNPQVKRQLEDLEEKMVSSIKILRSGIVAKEIIKRKAWINGAITGSVIAWTGFIISIIIRNI